MYILTSPRLAGVVVTGTYLMCLCVWCVCVHTCARMRVCMCVYVCVVCMRVCVYTHMCVCLCVCVRECMGVHVGACVEQIHLSCLFGRTPELLHLRPYSGCVSLHACQRWPRVPASSHLPHLSHLSPVLHYHPLHA